MKEYGIRGILRWIKHWLKKIPPITILGVFFCRVLRGCRAYSHILESCPVDEGWTRYFMDYDGSGDTYLTCGYLHSKGMIGPKDAFIASGGLSLKIASLFPFGRYVQLPPKDALTVRVMERFYGQRLALSPLLYESEYLAYSGLLRMMEGHRGLDFMSMLKIGLEVNVGLTYSELPWQQPEFPYHPAEVEEIFHTHNLIPGRSVLLAPYAGKHDMWGIPMAFYAELAHQLQEKGYTVCTNSGSPGKESPVPGTVPILVPHRLIRPFCERAGGFIGLRSGLCDMISAAKGCKKIILYSPNIPVGGVCSHQAFFSLGSMGLCNDVTELEIMSYNLPGSLPQFIVQILSK